MSRPSTPPRAASDAPVRAPLTPEQVRKIEINRLKAKAIRDQKEAEARRTGSSSATAPRPTTVPPRPPNGTRISNTIPATSRDARHHGTSSSLGVRKASGPPNDGIQPARKFTKYIDYDFSKMTDTKGGFLTVEDDPHNKALHSRSSDLEKPANMTLAEWERSRLLKTLRDQKSGPFEPGISVLRRENTKKCRECGSLEIDFKWDEVFSCPVCHLCKEKLPEKYSLLTKTEAKEDYLLTDPELKDEELLPHLDRPNPHKSTWNNMMLYLRYQVEEYAFSPRKWGSPEALDAEFSKREAEKKRRKEEKFRTKLHDLKKRTRVEAYRRARGKGGDAGDNAGRHQHQWGRAVEDPDSGCYYVWQLIPEDILNLWDAFIDKHPELARDLTQGLFKTLQRDVTRLTHLHYILPPLHPSPGASQLSSSAPTFSPGLSTPRLQSHVCNEDASERLKLFSWTTSLKGHERKKSRDDEDAGQSTKQDLPRLPQKTQGKRRATMPTIRTDFDADDLEELAGFDDDLSDNGGLAQPDTRGRRNTVIRYTSERKGEEEVEEAEDEGSSAVWKLEKDLARAKEKIKLRATVAKK
ncbi:MAG: hypothetical protein M1823_003537 [Watsoniomyces obsoletus]|nr:MAG: hypothetical protein M1823_003537 [Watsoniomyces obsoletus]